MAVDIGQYKFDMLLDIINTPNIVVAIDSQNKNFIHDEPDSLMYNNLFPYLKIPDTQEEGDTYILLAVDITNPVSNNSSFVNMRLKCWVVAHQNRMYMKGANATRIDYLSKEIMQVLNGSTKYGFGVLRLMSNRELVLDERHQYRELIFDTFDMSNDPCG